MDKKTSLLILRFAINIVTVGYAPFMCIFILPLEIMKHITSEDSNHKYKSHLMTVPEKLLVMYSHGLLWACGRKGLGTRGGGELVS